MNAAVRLAGRFVGLSADRTSMTAIRMSFRHTARRALHAFESSVIYPWAAYRGWRPSSFRTVQPSDLDYPLGYDDEDGIKDAVRVVAAFTVLSFDRLASLWSQVKWLDQHRIDGALVECGVRAGGASAMMALAHAAFCQPPHRTLHLFDSFAAMPQATGDDGVVVKRLVTEWNAEPNVPADVSMRLLLDRVGYPATLLRQHVGYFEETLPNDGVTLGPIALLRLDADLSQATRVCLAALYGLVSPGGIVVIDDYGFAGCRKAVDEFVRALPTAVMLHRIDCVGRYWVKPLANTMNFPEDPSPS
jgi:O-methyltransferase